ncbi:MAG TPA: roadblock/LC7 domain-containing protein [Gemmatimonadaceae bacterium]|nr:roadblock/LC7 domain-containing protein [Gemmatimonadaceae bacterium]
MSDEIRRLSDALASDPASLAFVPLADALRRSGQADVALRIVLRGLERHAYNADAHDVAARVYADLSDWEHAKDEWEMALQLSAGHVGALRGLGFLAYQRGDLQNAERYLRDAAGRSPNDAGIRTALERTLAARRADEASAEATPAPPSTKSTYSVAEPLGELVVDAAGLILAGELRDAAGLDVSASVGAELSGVRSEAERALERLGLGAWRALTIDAQRATVGLAPAPNDAVTLVAAAPQTAAGLFRRYLHRAGQRALAFFEATV